MGILKLIGAGTVLYILFAVYSYLDGIEAFKKVSYKWHESCRVIPGAEGMEDLTPWRQFIISGANNNAKLWQLKEYGLNAPDGSMVYIDTLANPLEVRHSKIKDFPAGLGFHPLGVYIHNEKYIYVINHAYNRGGERVEVLEIQGDSPAELLYLRSIYLPKELTGRSNDLIIIGENDELLITTYMPYPDSEETGRDMTKLGELKNLLNWSFKIKSTYIYHCKGGINPECPKVKGSESIMNNGITWDEKNKKVYAVNVPEKRLRIFDINKNAENILTYDRDVQTPYAMDNVEFDPETGLIYAGAIAKIVDFSKIVGSLRQNKTVDGFWGGSFKIDTKNNYEIRDMIITNHTFFGISGSLVKNKKLYHGSWYFNGTLVCDA